MFCGKQELCSILGAILPTTTDKEFNKLYPMTVISWLCVSQIQACGIMKRAMGHELGHVGPNSR